MLRATILAVFSLALAATQANAASCHSFAVIKSYDAAASTLEVEWTKGKTQQYFPRGEGATGEIQKIPKRCRRSQLKVTTVPVKATGGRMSVTQLRENRSGKMTNDLESADWFKAEIEKLIASGEPVVTVLRPGRKKSDPVPMTTIYLPVTQAELDEIKRLEEQVEDM